MTTVHVKAERSHVHDADLSRWWIEYSFDDINGFRREWWFTAHADWLFWIFAEDGTVVGHPRRFKRHRA